ncbi:MAG TPA: polysaccharide biosynthesis tyrosine autokinase [Pyrinomonadaceae bacterium]|nr:polysaccharide biosynthesis tyrosine autokinase [Pyrinomonadaceae bacterium]
MKDVSRRTPQSRLRDEGPILRSVVPYSPTAFVNEEPEELNTNYLRTYWQAVRQNLWLIAGITLFATLAVAVYQFRQPDQYQAQARVEIGHDGSVPGLKENANFAGGPSEDSVYFNTQLQILTSPALLRRVVKTLDLEHDKSFPDPNQAAQNSTWSKWLNSRGTANRVPSTNAGVLPVSSSTAPSIRNDLIDAKRLAPWVDALTKGLKVEPIKETRTEIKETRLINISFNHNVPQIASRVVNAVADTAAIMNLERKAEATMIAAEFLQKRIAELQSQIRRGEKELVVYAENNQIVSLDPAQNTVVERLTGLNRELLDAENERRKAEAAYKAALAPNAVDSMASELTNQNNPQEIKLAELRQRRVQLLVENTEEWPEVKELDKQIAEVERQIKDKREDTAAGILNSLQTRYRQAIAREESLRGAYNEQDKATIAQNQAAINYRILQQEIETNKGILQSLLQHSKENDITQAGLTNSIHVIDYATVPDQPVGPRRLLNVGLAFLLSMGFATAWPLIRERFDNTLRSTSDVEKKLHVPAIAIVPPIKGASRRGLLSSIRPLALLGNGRVNSHPELLLGNHDPIVARVYHQLRATMLFPRDGVDIKSLLVTSSLPNEGKTTTAINTAISLAESGANVLLVDGDLRRPNLHEILEVDNDRGLSNALSDGMETSEILSLIKKTQVEGLSLLTSGQQLQDSERLLDREKLSQLIAILESEFTHIVIDSPPIVPFADSVILGAEVDGVLVVVQGGKTPQEIVLRSLRLLDDVDALIVGVMLNKTNLQPLDTYYQSYCQKYYLEAR